MSQTAVKKKKAVETKASFKELEEKARAIRISIIEMLAEAGSGHTAGALGMADIFTALYFGGLLKYDAKKPDWPERDRLVLSNGHICTVLYATMSHAGFFPVEELKTLRKIGSRLQGHPHREWLTGLETSSGPLGSGLSQAVGMALAERMDDKKSDKKFFCLMSDGEMECGQTWEAAMLAGKEKLGNLIGIIDRNNIQISDYVNNIMPIEPLRAKWDAFNWKTLEIDGNNFEEITAALKEAREGGEKPTVIIANTIAGKGVPKWENKFEWHGRSPTREEAEKAIKLV